MTVVLKTWMTKAGLKAEIRTTDGNTVVYVAVTKWDRLYGVNRLEVVERVPDISQVCPAGLIGAGKLPRDVAIDSDPDWWFGAPAIEEQRQTDIEVMGENLARVLASVK